MYSSGIPHSSFCHKHGPFFRHLHPSSLSAADAGWCSGCTGLPKTRPRSFIKNNTKARIFMWRLDGIVAFKSFFLLAKLYQAAILLP